MRVACPWFEPLAEADADWPRPARAPLGRLFTGVCRAPGAPLEPEPDLLHEPCNFGYGRDRCPHFPSVSAADAVRFSLRGNRIVWILEKDCAPVAHGYLEDCPDAIVRLQGEAFRRS